MKTKRWIGILFALALTTGLYAQISGERTETVEIDGHILTQLITEEGDTLLVANLDDVQVTSFRKFDNRDDYLLYMKYRYYANKVYPYAVEAIRIFREVERATDEMKNRKRRKHIKNLHKELKEEFSDPLKDLSKTQGMILTKMIERELDTSMHDLIKGLRGGFEATKWSFFGMFYGYHLKQKYEEGENPLLDAVLQDFELTHSFD